MQRDSKMPDGRRPHMHQQWITKGRERDSHMDYHQQHQQTQTSQSGTSLWSSHYHFPVSGRTIRSTVSHYCDKLKEGKVIMACDNEGTINILVNMNGYDVHLMQLIMIY